MFQFRNYFGAKRHLEVYAHKDTSHSTLRIATLGTHSASHRNLPRLASLPLDALAEDGAANCAVHRMDDGVVIAEWWRSERGVLVLMR